MRSRKWEEDRNQAVNRYFGRGAWRASSHKTGLPLNWPHLSVCVLVWIRAYDVKDSSQCLTWQDMSFRNWYPLFFYLGLYHSKILATWRIGLHLVHLQIFFCIVTIEPSISDPGESFNLPYVVSAPTEMEKKENPETPVLPRGPEKPFAEGGYTPENWGFSGLRLFCDLRGASCIYQDKSKQAA